jgi:hypothetical protein
VGPLFLDVKRIPKTKDFAETIAGEAGEMVVAFGPPGRRRRWTRTLVVPGQPPAYQQRLDPGIPSRQIAELLHGIRAEAA